MGGLTNISCVARTTLLVLLLLCANNGWSQETEPAAAIVTDRPDVTESSIVVPKGSLQFENGITWTTNHSNQSVDFSETLVSGILFVLRSGIPWEMLPQELRCGSGMTCWRRLRDWQEAGIWEMIHFVLLDWLARYGQIDWSRAVVDSGSIRAVFGGGRRVPILPTGLNRVANAI